MFTRGIKKIIERVEDGASKDQKKEKLKTNEYVSNNSMKTIDFEFIDRGLGGGNNDVDS